MTNPQPRECCEKCDNSKVRVDESDPICLVDFTCPCHTVQNAAKGEFDIREEFDYEKAKRGARDLVNGTGKIATGEPLTTDEAKVLRTIFPAPKEETVSIYACCFEAKLRRTECPNHPSAEWQKAHAPKEDRREESKVTAANINELFGAISKGERPDWIQLHRDALDDLLSQAEERGREEAIADCINAIPLRSDWDDDEKVTAQMIINSTREALDSLLAAARTSNNPTP